MIRKPLLLSATAVAFLLVSTAGSQCAQADEAVSPARQLFLDARKLAAEGKYAEACPKFEESLRLEVGVGTQFNLADCWEHIGRTASARALFLGAAASAKAVGQSDREQVLRERAAALEPRLSKVVIEVLATDKKLVVKRNDLPLEEDSWGKAVAMDPGQYTISARAPGKQAWEKQIEVTAATPLITVQVPELVASAPPKPTAAEAAADAEALEAAPAPSKKAPPPSAPPATDTDRDPGVNYRAVTVAGLGLAAITVGAVMGLKYRKANSDAEAICPSGQGCTIKQIQDHDRLVDDARTARSWSYAGFGVGALGLVGAGALWYFQKPKTTAGITWQATPVASADGSYGAALHGKF
jgi:hypothetical protein